MPNSQIIESEEWSSQWIFQFKQLERRSLKKKKSGLQRDSNPWPHGFESRWSPDFFYFFFRLLLSSCLNWKIHCEDHSSLSSMTAVQIYELFHIYLHHFTPYGKIWTQQIGLAPNVWLHSSVGRASHRYRGGHGFESRWSPDFFFFSGFFFPVA